MGWVGQGGHKGFCHFSWGVGDVEVVGTLSGETGAGMGVIKIFVTQMKMNQTTDPHPTPLPNNK